MARGQGIKRVADLFETYRKRLRAPQKTVEEAFVEVVRDVCGFEPERGFVTYKPSSRTLVFTAPGMMKSEVFLQKDEILAHLKGRLGVGSAPRDII